MIMIWTKDNTNAVIDYISTNDINKRNEIFNTRLYSSINRIIHIVMNKYYLYDNDVRQELLIKSLKILDKVKLDKVKAIQNLLYISFSNQMKTDYIKNELHNTRMKDYIFFDEVEPIEELDIDKKIGKIIYELELKRNSYDNPKYILYINHIINYLTNQLYNTIDLPEYICKEMNINNKKYLSYSYITQSKKLINNLLT